MKRRLPLLSILQSLVLIAIAIATASCAILQPSDDPADSGQTRPERTPDPTMPAKEPSFEDVPDVPETVETQWDVVAVGTQSAVRIPVTRAVSNARVWRDIWHAITANQTDPPEVPEVDFERETALVLILGERPSGGYSVGVADIIDRRDEVEVVVAVSRPEPGEMVSQALTTPYSITVVPVTGKEFIFTGDSLEAGFEGD